MAKHLASISKPIQNPLQELFIKEISNLYNENQKFLAALPEISDAVHTSSLKNVLLDHAKDIQAQISRFEKMFENHKIKPNQIKSIVMDSFIKELNQILKNHDASALKDAELISLLQKINHYEIACHDIALTFANQLDYNDEAAVLTLTLEEANAIAVKFKTIANGGFFTKGVIVIASQEPEKLT